MKQARFYFQSLIITASLLPLASCGGTSDVTSDPAYAFKGMAGTTWKSKVELAIAESKSGTLYLFTSSDFSVEEYKKANADPAYVNGGERIIDIRPIGTEIRITNLTYSNSIESSYVDVYGTVLAGPFAGKKVALDLGLFERNDFLFPNSGYPRSWAVSADKLEKP